MLFFLEKVYNSLKVRSLGVPVPFKSQAQRKWMHANKPKLAKSWAKKSKGKKLPKKVKKK